MTATDGDQVILNCMLIGRPWPSVQWFHNGKRLDHTSGFIIVCDEDLHKCALVIMECFPDDTGSYTCIAYNDYGEAITSSTLRVVATDATQTDLEEPPCQAETTMVHRVMITKELVPDVPHTAPQEETSTPALYPATPESIEALTKIPITYETYPPEAPSSGSEVIYTIVTAEQGPLVEWSSMSDLPRAQDDFLTENESDVDMKDDLPRSYPIMQQGPMYQEHLKAEAQPKEIILEVDLPQMSTDEELEEIHRSVINVIPPGFKVPERQRSELNIITEEVPPKPQITVSSKPNQFNISLPPKRNTTGKVQPMPMAKPSDGEIESKTIVVHPKKGASQQITINIPKPGEMKQSTCIKVQEMTDIVSETETYKETTIYEEDPMIYSDSEHIHIDRTVEDDTPLSRPDQRAERSLYIEEQKPSAHEVTMTNDYSTTKVIQVQKPASEPVFVNVELQHPSFEKDAVVSDTAPEVIKTYTVETPQDIRVEHVMTMPIDRSEVQEPTEGHQVIPIVHVTEVLSDQEEDDFWDGKSLVIMTSNQPTVSEPHTTSVNFTAIQDQPRPHSTEKLPAALDHPNKPDTSSPIQVDKPQQPQYTPVEQDQSKQPYCKQPLLPELSDQHQFTEVKYVSEATSTIKPVDHVMDMAQINEMQIEIKPQECEVMTIKRVEQLVPDMSEDSEMPDDESLPCGDADTTGRPEDTRVPETADKGKKPAVVLTTRGSETIERTVYSKEETEVEDESGEKGLVILEDDTFTMTPPHFIEPLAPQVLREGDTCIFVGRVTGVPMPQITWYWELPRNMANRYRVKGELEDQLKANEIHESHTIFKTYDTNSGLVTLTIEHVSVDDMASVTCEATNPIGRATSTANLVVVRKYLS